MRLFKNKSGFSVGFSWVFGIVSLFGLGVMYIVFNQVFMGHLVPTIKNMANDSTSGIDAATVLLINSNIDKYMTFFHTLPYVLVFVIILYMVVAAIRKEGEGGYQ